MTPSQQYKQALSRYEQTGKSLEEARERTDEAKKELDALLNLPKAMDEADCPTRLQIAQSADQFAAMKQQEATAAQQDADAAEMLRQSAWSYYFQDCD